MENTQKNNYSRPPVTEAVISVNISPSVGDNDLFKFVSKLKNIYPDLETTPNFDIKVDITERNGVIDSNTNLTKLGQTHRLSRENMTQVVIVSPNSITVSQLAPYRDWDDLFNRFIEVFDIKSRLIGYSEITRIGVRYINRIDVPLVDGENLIHQSEYLNVYPFLPKKFESIGDYAINCLIPYDEYEIKLNSAVIASPLLKHIAFLIDIDLYKDSKLGINPGPIPQKNEDFYKYVYEMRRYKNEIFESLITDRTRSIF